MRRILLGLVSGLRVASLFGGARGASTGSTRQPLFINSPSCSRRRRTIEVRSLRRAGDLAAPDRDCNHKPCSPSYRQNVDRTIDGPDRRASAARNHELLGAPSAGGEPGDKCPSRYAIALPPHIVQVICVTIPEVAQSQQPPTGLSFRP